MTWTDLAACRDQNPEIFYPTIKPGYVAKRARAAKRICGACPVQSECFRDVMEFEGERTHWYRFGIWAGLTPEERSALAQPGVTA